MTARTQAGIDTKLADIEKKFKQMLASASEEMENKIITTSFQQQVNPSDKSDLKSEWEEKLNGLHAYIDSEIKAVRSEFNKLLTPIVKRLDEQEQYSRRNCLLFHGIQENVSEDTNKLILQTINSKLNLTYELTTADIDRSHRIGSKKRTNPSAVNNSQKPRPIIVKFISYASRNDVWRSKRQLRGTNVAVTESLTKSRMQLVLKCVSLFGKKEVWTQDGKIFILSSTGVKYALTHEDELTTIQRRIGENNKKAH